MGITIEELQMSLPQTMKAHATQELVDNINNAATDPYAAENIKDNFISYSTVLQDGRFKTEDYLKAVTYVSFKLMGMTNLEAYTRTFPTRYQNMVAKGYAGKDIAAFVGAYNKNKLVNLIMQQTMVPTWVLNQPLYQKAINVQADLMINAKSEKVKSDAANSLLTHLKPPEAKEVNLNIGMQDNSGLNDLKNALAEMAKQQRDLIQKGVSTKQIAAQPIVEAEYTEVETDKTGSR